jgi:hypothetical protein
MGMGGQRHAPAALSTGKTQYPLYSSIFQKSVEKIKVSLISDKNEGYFTWRPTYILDHISLTSS